MNFEEWILSYNLSEFEPITATDMKAAWNTALDEAVKAINGRQDYSSRTRDEFAETVETFKE